MRWNPANDPSIFDVRERIRNPDSGFDDPGNPRILWVAPTCPCVCRRQNCLGFTRHKTAVPFRECDESRPAKASNARAPAFESGWQVRRGKAFDQRAFRLNRNGFSAIGQVLNPGPETDWIP